MAKSEDVASTTVSLVGGIAGVFANSQSDILLSLCFAAAVKALPSLYNEQPAKRRSNTQTVHRLALAEDCVLFIAAFVGYLFTAVTSDLTYALAGLTVAVVGKALPSLVYQRGGRRKDHDGDHRSKENLIMFGIAILSIAFWVATQNLSYVTYVLVSAFVAKGLGSFGQGSQVGSKQANTGKATLGQAEAVLAEATATGSTMETQG